MHAAHMAAAADTPVHTAAAAAAAAAPDAAASDASHAPNGGPRTDAGWPRYCARAPRAVHNAADMLSLGASPAGCAAPVSGAPVTRGASAVFHAQRARVVRTDALRANSHPAPPADCTNSAASMELFAPPTLPREEDSGRTAGLDWTGLDWTEPNTAEPNCAGRA
ncbi:testis-specific gene A8 protein-like [Schistocerca nitens]|uniref:testis-specific gene A8 protein-like n=1 Tax=Schistocerca nitens TaxID=7011 RepID=UPI0021185A45|nr:testis-specific gene A8 protein-like [Schistocerca nitens]